MSVDIARNYDEITKACPQEIAEGLSMYRELMKAKDYWSLDDPINGQFHRTKLIRCRKSTDDNKELDKKSYISYDRDIGVHNLKENETANQNITTFLERKSVCW